MVEIIYKIIKLLAALSLQLLSFSLLFWVFSLHPHFSIKHILYTLCIGVLVYIFVSFSLSLIMQAFPSKKRMIRDENENQQEVNEEKIND
jgi:ABC-type polysaccharide/polyol phosphate export permease